MAMKLPPIAPDDIRGRIPPAREYDALRGKRLDWVREQVQLDIPQRQIAFALGISPAAVCNMLSVYGLQPGSRVPNARGIRMIAGIRMGHLGPIFDAAEPIVQHKVLAVASKHKVTVAEAVMMIVTNKLEA